MNNQRSYQRNLIVVLCVFTALTMSPTVAILAKQNRCRVTVANHLDHIKKGMTIREVENVFGRQGKDFPWVGDGALAWPIDDGAIIAIYFNRKHSAQWIFTFRRETWWEKIQRILAQPWQ